MRETLDVANRDACLGGFGKEFVGLVQGRDIRSGSIAAITDAQLRQIYTWCRLSPDARGRSRCSEQALAALYWGGENDPHVSMRYCSLISDADDKKSCFQNLIGAVSSYVKDQSYRESFCGEIPHDYQERCRAQLLVGS